MAEPEQPDSNFLKTTIASLKKIHVINPNLADALIGAGIATVTDYITLTNAALKGEIHELTIASIMQMDGYVRSKGHRRVEEMSNSHLAPDANTSFAQNLRRRRAGRHPGQPGAHTPTLS